MITSLHFGRLDLLRTGGSAVTPLQRNSVVAPSQPPATFRATKPAPGPFGDRSAYSDRKNSVQCS